MFDCDYSICSRSVASRCTIDGPACVETCRQLTAIQSRLERRAKDVVRAYDELGRYGVHAVLFGLRHARLCSKEGVLKEAKELVHRAWLYSKSYAELLSHYEEAYAHWSCSDASLFRACLESGISKLESSVILREAKLLVLNEESTKGAFDRGDRRRKTTSHDKEEDGRTRIALSGTGDPFNHALPPPTSELPPQPASEPASRRAMDPPECRPSTAAEELREGCAAGRRAIDPAECRPSTAAEELREGWAGGGTACGHQGRGKTITAASQPASQPAFQPAFQPEQQRYGNTVTAVSEPAFKPASEPAFAPASEPAFERASASESAFEPSEPAFESASESASEPASEPVFESASESAFEPASEREPPFGPAFKPAFEPASEPVLEPASEPAFEPASERGPPFGPQSGGLVSTDSRLTSDLASTPTSEPASTPTGEPSASRSLSSPVSLEPPGSSPTGRFCPEPASTPTAERLSPTPASEPPSSIPAAHGPAASQLPSSTASSEPPVSTPPCEPSLEPRASIPAAASEPPRASTPISGPRASTASSEDPPSTRASSKAWIEMEEITEAELSCPVCLELLYKPISLRCGHVFCTSCAVQAAGLFSFQYLEDAPRSARCATCRAKNVYRSAMKLTQLGRLLSARSWCVWASVELQRRGGMSLLLTVDVDYMSKAALVVGVLIGVGTTRVFPRIQRTVIIPEFGASFSLNSAIMTVWKSKSITSKGTYSSIEDVYETFANFGSGAVRTPAKLVNMDGGKFAKFCRDGGLLDKQFTATAVDLIFSKVKPKGDRKINYDEFVQALELIAEAKGISMDDLKHQIMGAGGPSSSGTVPDAVKFHDDKSLYTGVHARGGPTTVDNKITLSNLADRSPSDIRGRKM
ncbi:hypothetical protein CBR_g30699 [Chara braunii]|uniref:RING-type domain-containing protein n=1 Tax=Chara braunii TaxID=69332 RepID=A0A388LDF2_CHABU|nr:hypothetical protein CBR_g30699 [Chara braunii]|eukprot:GBG80331.1 hypothetical protein CBR_g30699 [Chara braunii]